MPDPTPSPDAARSGAQGAITPDPTRSATSLDPVLGATTGGGRAAGRADLLPSLQAALGGAYDLERELGGGGMSRVFVATERALGRRVAVKVLSPELMQGVSTERFAREVALAARLQDPHIVPVLTTGTTADGLPWYTMPFVEGESLRERLRRGTVPLEEGLRILRDVAEALEYAHARGVVHRDIKPENVLLSGRNAVVADFGIAKAMSAARATVPHGGTLTSIGLSLGTPGYMAPEQAAGDAIDHRVDLYAWGMMAWELLAGRHPFAPRTQAAQLMAAQLTEMPQWLDDVRPGLPPSLGALVMACLAKEPASRPSDAATLLAGLGGATTDLAITSGRRVPVPAAAGRRKTAMLAGGALLLALAGGGAWMARRGDGARDGAAGAGTVAGAGATPSLAVLPFEHQGESADAYLTDGITDEIRNKLTGVSNLVVIARASSNRYKGKDVPPQQIAKELGVRWLLTGTVRVVGSGDQRRVLVRPELVEVTADGRLQSKGGTPFDGPMADVVRAQGEVASQVVGSMEVAVGGTDRAKLVAVSTRDAQAYDLYLRGLAALGGGTNSDGASLQRAIPLLEEAVARDSTLAEGWDWLARAYVSLYNNVSPSPETARRARDAAARLAMLAPGSADALRTGALIRRVIDTDYTGALELLRQANRIAPRDPAVLSTMANTLLQLGRFDEALTTADAAIQLDPRLAQLHSARTIFLLRMRRYAEARTSAARARALAPTSLIVAHRQVVVEVAAGDLAAAQRVYATLATDFPNDRMLAYIAMGYDLWWVPEARAQARLIEIPEAAYGGVQAAMSTVRAQVHAARGERALAQAWADSAVRELRRQVVASPDDAQYRVILGLMLAYRGDSAAAIAAAQDGLARAEASPSARMTDDVGYFHYVAARAALLAGDRPRALGWLREVVARRTMFSPGWIRLDPAFAALRGAPDFERALAEAP